jgi:lysophospholipid acyltransferase (LPLAT)-like uncharacterized protein
LKKWLRQKLAPRLGPFLAAWVVRFLGATLRLEVEDPHGFLGKAKQEPYVFAFWHNRLLLMPYLYRKFFPERKLTVMMSMSRDGEITSGMAKRFGIQAARGSSSRQGMKAFMALVRKIRHEGSDVAITPDGPRGPIYSMHAGILQLAEAGEVPITPVTCHYDDKWELASWDRFQIPKPFTRCRVLFGEPVPVPAGASQQQLEEAGERLRKSLGI